MLAAQSAPQLDTMMPQRSRYQAQSMSALRAEAAEAVGYGDSYAQLPPPIPEYKPGRRKRGKGKRARKQKSDALTPLGGGNVPMFTRLDSNLDRLGVDSSDDFRNLVENRLQQCVQEWGSMYSTSPKLDDGMPKGRHRSPVGKKKSPFLTPLPQDPAQRKLNAPSLISSKSESSVATRRRKRPAASIEPADKNMTAMQIWKSHRAAKTLQSRVRDWMACRPDRKNFLVILAMKEKARLQAEADAARMAAKFASAAAIAAASIAKSLTNAATSLVMTMAAETAKNLERAGVEHLHMSKDFEAVSDQEQLRWEASLRAKWELREAKEQEQQLREEREGKEAELEMGREEEEKEETRPLGDIGFEEMERLPKYKPNLWAELETREQIEAKLREHLPIQRTPSKHAATRATRLPAQAGTPSSSTSTSTSASASASSPGAAELRAQREYAEKVTMTQEQLAQRKAQAAREWEDAHRGQNRAVDKLFRRKLSLELTTFFAVHDPDQVPSAARVLAECSRDNPPALLAFSLKESFGVVPKGWELWLQKGEAMGKARLASEQQEVAKRSRAAAKIQAVSRGKRGRAAAAAKKGEDAKRTNAAVQIQAVSRGHRERGMLKEAKESDAAVMIQAVSRGKRGRAAAAAKKGEDAKRTNAAVQIQAVSRGHRERGMLKEAKESDAAVMIQAVSRGKRGRAAAAVQRAEEAQRTSAAVRIQALSRGRRERAQLENARAERRAEHRRAVVLRREAQQREKKEAAEQVEQAAARRAQRMAARAAQKELEYQARLEAELRAKQQGGEGGEAPVAETLEGTAPAAAPTSGDGDDAADAPADAVKVLSEDEAASCVQRAVRCQQASKELDWRKFREARRRKDCPDVVEKPIEQDLHAPVEEVKEAEQKPTDEEEADTDGEANDDDEGEEEEEEEEEEAEQEQLQELKVVSAKIKELANRQIGEAQEQTQAQVQVQAQAAQEPSHSEEHGDEGWWEEAWDEEHGTYYYHNGTGDSSWERPAEMDMYTQDEHGNWHGHKAHAAAESTPAPHFDLTLVDQPAASPIEPPVGAPPGIVFHQPKKRSPSICL